MVRPKGLALTAWLMLCLSLLGLGSWIWSRYHSPVHTHTHLGFVVLGIIVFAMKSCGFICIWYYYQGRNWARIVILVVSVLALFNLRLLNHGTIVIRGVVVSEAVLGIFFLYWLNTSEVRSFFRRSTVASDQPAQML
jgi:hypothetical protein